MTKAQLKAKVAALGLVCQWRAEWSEWRVTVPPGSMHHIKSVDDAASEDIAAYIPGDDGEEWVEVWAVAQHIRRHLEANPPPGFRAPWAPRHCV